MKKGIGRWGALALALALALSAQVCVRPAVAEETGEAPARTEESQTDTAVGDTENQEKEEAFSGSEEAATIGETAEENGSQEMAEAEDTGEAQTATSDAVDEQSEGTDETAIAEAAETENIETGEPSQDAELTAEPTGTEDAATGEPAQDAEPTAEPTGMGDASTEEPAQDAEPTAEPTGTEDAATGEPAQDAGSTAAPTDTETEAPATEAPAETGAEAVPVPTGEQEDGRGKVVFENVTEPECETPGSRDRVIYDPESGEELSRETEKLPPLGHDYEIVDKTIIRVMERCRRCGVTVREYNEQSRNLLDGLVRNMNRENVDYNAGVGEREGHQALKVTADPDEPEKDTEIVLWLKPDEIQTWMEDEIQEVIFENGNYSLGIELGEISADWFETESSENESVRQMEVYVFRLWETEDGSAGVQIEAMSGETCVTAGLFSGVEIRSGELNMSISENGIYQFE